MAHRDRLATPLARLQIRPYLLIVVCLGACRGPASTLTRIAEEGFIRAGYAHEPPYAFVDDTGHVGGESVEAFRAAMGALGVDSIRWTLLDFDDLIPALVAGRVDAVASGMFDTPERRDLVAFSRPTVCARPALLHRSSTPRPQGLEAFRAGGSLRLAVIEGAVEQSAARILGIPSERLVVVPDLFTEISVLRSGAAEALALSAPTARTTAEGSTDLAWATYDAPSVVASLVVGCSAIALRPDDDALRAAVDSAFAGYVGSAAQADVLARLHLTPDDVHIPIGPGGGTG